MSKIILDDAACGLLLARSGTRAVAAWAFLSIEFSRSDGRLTVAQQEALRFRLRRSAGEWKNFLELAESLGLIQRDASELLHPKILEDKKVELARVQKYRERSRAANEARWQRKQGVTRTKLSNKDPRRIQEGSKKEKEPKIQRADYVFLTDTDYERLRTYRSPVLGEELGNHGASWICAKLSRWKAKSPKRITPEALKRARDRITVFDWPLAEYEKYRLGLKNGNGEAEQSAVSVAEQWARGKNA